MKDTIKAKIGYRVKLYICPLNDNGDDVLVMDGIHTILTARKRTMDDYVDECKNGNNECAVKYEVFTTVKGNQFVYWGDTETGEDFLTKIIK